MRHTASPFLLGLRFKLAVSILLVVLVSMTALSFNLLKTIRSELTGHLLGQAGLLARSMARAFNLQRESGSPPVAELPDIASIQRTLLDFSEEEHLTSLAVYDREGRLLARQGESFDPPREGWRTDREGFEYLVISGVEGKLFARTALGGADPPPRLVMLFSLEKINQAIAFSQMKAIFEISLAALLIFLVLILLLTFMVINPLRTLNRGIEKITAGNLDYRVQVRTADEISFLADSINSMVGTLKENARTIETHLESLRQAHRSTLETQGKLIAAEKLASLGTLSAGVAHEVGNPLGAVIGYMDLLRKGNLCPEENADCLARAAAELDRIHQIMLELLNYARPAAEPFTSLDVNSLVRDLIENLTREGGLENLEVILDLEEDLPRPTGSPRKLEQVFINLIKNAVWATAPAGKLVITSGKEVPKGEAAEKPTVVLTFTDNGRGILENDLGRIFDPFFTTRLGQGGTGLGLAISRRIIEEMGGTITAQSDPGEKTSFTIRLQV